MKEFKISNKGSATLFHNPVLERLTRTNFIFPVGFYYLMSLICLVLSFINEEVNFVNVIWMFPTGMVVFSLVEYLIHRFFFHFNATTEKQQEFQYNIHGVHHEFPRDKDRLAMPPVISIFLATAFFFLFTFLVGNYGMILFAGFVAGYSTYLIIHYAVHAKKPPKNFLKFYWKHHSLHHYSSVDTAFSVSFPLWDYIFGTVPSKEKAAEIHNRLPDSHS